MSENKVKVLVIDDHPSEVHMLKIALEGAGYQVVCAYNGKDGKRKAKRERPDVIILDILMPEKDGLQAADELRGDLDCCNIPIIILSALNDPPLPVTDTGGPFLFHLWDAYLKKPFDPGVLLYHVDRLSRIRTTKHYKE